MRLSGAAKSTIKHRGFHSEASLRMWVKVSPKIGHVENDAKLTGKSVAICKFFLSSCRLIVFLKWKTGVLCSGVLRETFWHREKGNWLGFRKKKKKKCYNRKLGHLVVRTGWINFHHCHLFPVFSLKFIHSHLAQALSSYVNMHTINFVCDLFYTFFYSEFWQHNWTIFPHD